MDFARLFEAEHVTIIRYASGFAGGVVFVAIIWSISAMMRRRKMAAQQELKQQVMDGLDRSCGGIEEVISSIDLGNVNFSQLRSELVRRIATLDRRLEQHSEELDDYFVQLIVLRMENYAQFVAKLDDLSEAIGRYGGQDATAESFEESFEPPADVQPSADEQAPATGFESQPAAQPHMPPPGVPAFAEQSGSPGESPDRKSVV